MSIPAGQVQRATSSGTQVYLVIATAPVNMRPAGGDFVTYNQGTGVNTSQQFSFVEIQNFQSFPVVVSVWIGYDSFIDRRLILANSQTPDIAFPTYKTPNSANFVNIVDLSGGAFLDINNTQWLALYRKSIIISNLSSGSYLLNPYSPIGAGSTSGIGIIPPSPTPIKYDIAGNYTINTGGGPVNMVVCEIYSAILASTL